MTDHLTYVPTPRYAIGQTIWVVQEDSHLERWPCPDCGDTQRWVATTAAGEQIAVKCARCSGGSSLPRNLPTLDRRVSCARPRKLTIGSVQINTAYYRESPVAYMCEETGVGSGSVYYENTVYGSEAESQAAADEQNRQRQAEMDGAPRAMLAEEMRHFPIDAALGRAWEEELYHGYDRARDYREAIERVLDEDDEDTHTLDEARDVLRDACEDRPWRRPQPLAALVAAARSVAANPTTENLAALAEALKPLTPPEAREVNR